MTHRVTVDETFDRGEGPMFKAFCEDCDWCGDSWHHADQYSHHDDPAYEANYQAYLDGLDHIADAG